MRILFFDTETNGLPRDRKSLTQDTRAWPHVVQIAWQLWEYSADAATLVNKTTHIIKPDESLAWDQGSAAIHGISRERALAEGAPGISVLDEFKAIASTVNVLVAHNIAFDKPVLRASYYRINPSEDFDWWPGVEYCTMEGSKMLCKLPTRYAKPGDPYKYPKLSELVSYLHGSSDGYAFHSADADVECLRVCFDELVRRKVVPFDLWLRTLRVCAT